RQSFARAAEKSSSSNGQNSSKSLTMRQESTIRDGGPGCAGEAKSKIKSPPVSRAADLDSD
ncbi:hypothetical protein, partial [Stutzerimonas decontaminans]|uniref:hypothetical protein n=1 Tax=Stutzerimonas decontaminans TaxID=3022791 RepID=UPI001CA54E51